MQLRNKTVEKSVRIGIKEKEILSWRGAIGGRKKMNLEKGEKPRAETRGRRRNKKK